MQTSSEFSIFFRVVSWILGLLDLTCGIGTLLLSIFVGKWFSLGWGKKLESAYYFTDSMMAELEKKDNTVLKLRDSDIVWRSLPSAKDIELQEGAFLSLYEAFMPEESKLCRFKLVRPKSKDDTQDETYIIMVPGLGENTDMVMMHMAKHFARDYGWSTAILTAPLYGSRMPRNHKFFLISNSVQEVAVQLRGFISEIASLTAYFSNKSAHSRVCLTGFSAGAGVSSSAAAIAMMAGADGTRLACVSYVGIQSAKVALQDNIIFEPLLDWDALRKDDKYDRDTEKPPCVRRELMDELHKTRLSIATESLKKSRRESGRALEIAVVSAVAMADDAITPNDPEYYQALKILSGKPLNSFRLLPGGHVVAAILRPVFHRNAVIDAVKELYRN